MHGIRWCKEQRRKGAEAKSCKVVPAVSKIAAVIRSGAREMGSTFAARRVRSLN